VKRKACGPCHALLRFDQCCQVLLDYIEVARLHGRDATVGNGPHQGRAIDACCRAVGVHGGVYSNATWIFIRGTEVVAKLVRREPRAGVAEAPCLGI
jgi:hypothetical protein